MISLQTGIQTTHLCITLKRLRPTLTSLYIGQLRFTGVVFSFLFWLLISRLKSDRLEFASSA